jgi:single-strand DNA-binding protein
MSASNINSVVITGRLTADPKEYETGTDKVYALLRLAINRRLGEDKKKTIYYDVKVWNGHAKVCVEHLRKGALVAVKGYLDQFDNIETGKRWNFITAEEVEFCSRAKTPDAE